MYNDVCRVWMCVQRCVYSMCVHTGCMCVQGCVRRVRVQAGVRLPLSLVCSLALTFGKAEFAAEEGATIGCSEAISQGWHLKGGVRH